MGGDCWDIIFSSRFRFKNVRWFDWYQLHDHTRSQPIYKQGKTYAWKCHFELRYYWKKNSSKKILWGDMTPAIKTMGALWVLSWTFRNCNSFIDIWSQKKILELRKVRGYNAWNVLFWRQIVNLVRMAS